MFVAAAMIIGMVAITMFFRGTDAIGGVFTKSVELNSENCKGKGGGGEKSDCLGISKCENTCSDLEVDCDNWTVQ